MRHKNRSYIIGSILWPFAGLFAALRNWRQPWAMNVFWVVCAYMGAIQIYHPKEQFVTLQADLFEGEKLVHTEKIQERLYDPEWILEVLRKVGFQEVCCTDQLLESETGHATTWFVIAQK